MSAATCGNGLSRPDRPLPDFASLIRATIGATGRPRAAAIRADRQREPDREALRKVIMSMMQGRAAALLTGARFQSVANDGAGTGEIVNLASNAPLPALPLGPYAGEAAEQIAEDAEHYPDKRKAGELDQDHLSTLTRARQHCRTDLSVFQPVVE